MSATAERRPSTEVMTYREALRLALREELARDERVFVMGEEVGVFDGAYKVTAGLLDEFGPDRVRDTPISEEGFVGAGVGAAMLGERPVVEIMTLNFLLVAMDQVVNHAAKIGAMFGGEVRCPLVIRTPNGAGNQLTAQHSQSLRGLVRRHARAEGRRAREPGRRQGPAEGGDPRRRPGARRREPRRSTRRRATVPLDPELRHADRARRGGARGLRPHDRRALATRPSGRCTSPRSWLAESTASTPRSSTCARCARSTSRRSPRRSRRPTASSASRRAGRPTASRAELAARIQKACFDDLDAPVERVGMAEVPLPYAKNLETAALPNEDRIARAVLATLDLD